MVRSVLLAVVLVACSSSGRVSDEPTPAEVVAGAGGDGGSAAQPSAGEAGAPAEPVVVPGGGAEAGGAPSEPEPVDKSGEAGAASVPSEPKDLCPEIKACTEKCDIVKAGPVPEGLRCSFGNFVCGDLMGYYTSDGLEFLLTNSTSTEVGRRVSTYCLSMPPSQ